MGDGTVGGGIKHCYTLPREITGCSRLGHNWTSLGPHLFTLAIPSVQLGVGTKINTTSSSHAR